MFQTKFIYDDKILPAIYELIEQAQEEIIIISPYINLWGHLTSKLEKSFAYKVFIARKNQDGKLDEVIKKMNELGIQLRVVENLHAKIYLNEKRCIISSMNLYDYSTANSKEVAIIIDDEETLCEINKYINEDLFPKSEIVTNTASKMIAKGFRNLVGLVSNKAQKEAPKSIQGGSYSPKSRDGEKGYCIRCRTIIKGDPEKPLCANCYNKWKVHNNKAYKEKYCHVCGKEGSTSLNRPVCLSCYKKAH
jgi:phosphatidylserine/phosphatidylglycerophosphate/cardiolipin synthase-like enzyme